ncbi:MAG: hypothetical protein NTX15_04375 [Candidatus Kapabacteria bacterium]|nr:hypothetical protein [Candidatus Kapabacteria bacterium]
MEILIAVMCYFGLMSPQQAGITPMQMNQMIMNNQATVQYYIDSPDAYSALVAERAHQIDRTED